MFHTLYSEMSESCMIGSRLPPSPKTTCFWPSCITYTWNEASTFSHWYYFYSSLFLLLTEYSFTDFLEHSLGIVPPCFMQCVSSNIGIAFPNQEPVSWSFTPLSLRSYVCHLGLKSQIWFKIFFTLNIINNILASIWCHMHYFSFPAQVFSSSACWISILCFCFLSTLQLLSTFIFPGETKVRIQTGYGANAQTLWKQRVTIFTSHPKDKNKKCFC